MTSDQKSAVMHIVVLLAIYVFMWTQAYPMMHEKDIWAWLIMSLYTVLMVVLICLTVEEWHSMR